MKDGSWPHRTPTTHGSTGHTVQFQFALPDMTTSWVLSICRRARCVFVILILRTASDGGEGHSGKELP